MRTGYFGGTFDPPHAGHLAVARSARDRFALDRVLLAPTGKQPLKPSTPRASYEDRLAMVRLLCDRETALEASSLDAPHADGSANYTIDVLRTLKQNGDAVFCIVGLDSFLDLPRWKDPDALLETAEWIVVSRPGVSLSNTALADSSQRVHHLDDICVDVSSTALREAFLHGDLAPAGLPETVRRYILEHHLYSKENDL